MLSCPQFSSHLIQLKNVILYRRHFVTFPSHILDSRTVNGIKHVTLSKFQQLFSTIKEQGMSSDKAVILLKLSCLQMVDTDPAKRGSLALQVFETTFDKNVQVYNALLNSFIYNGYKTSVSTIMDQMNNDNISPDKDTYTNLIGCHNINGDLENAIKLLEIIKSKDLPDIHLILAYMAYGQFLNGSLHKGMQVFKHMKSKSDFVPNEVFYFICKGLVESSNVEQLEEVINYLTSQNKKVLKTKHFVDLAYELLKNRQITVVLNLLKIVNMKDFHLSMVLIGLGSSFGREEVLMDLLQNYKLPKLNDFEKAKLVLITVSSQVSKCKSIEDIIKLADTLKVACNEQFIFNEILKQAYLLQSDLFFKILIEMKKKNLLIKPHMLLPAHSIKKDLSKIKNFCLSNDIKFDEMMLIEHKIYKTLDDVSFDFSVCDSSSEKVVRKLMYEALKIKKTDPDKLIKVLMQMERVNNFETILSDCIIEFVNQVPINNSLLKEKLFPLMKNLYNLNFRGIDEKRLLSQLHPSRHCIYKLFSAKHKMHLEAMNFSFNQNLSLLYVSSLYKDFKKLLSFVKRHCNDLKDSRNKISESKFIQNIVHDADKFTNQSQKNELFDFVTTFQIDSSTANIILWHYITTGNVEKVKELTNKQLLDKTKFFSYFIPSKYLHESMRLALTTYLTEIYGIEACNWIIYLSFLSNGMVNEAADFMKQKQLKWLNSDLAQNFSQCSNHVRSLPLIIDELLNQCQNIKGFIPFFFQMDFVESILKLKQFDILKIILNTADEHLYDILVFDLKDAMKKVASHKPSLLNLMLKDTECLSLLDNDAEDSLENLEHLVKVEKNFLRILAPTYLKRLVKNDELYEQARSILKNSRLNYNADYDYKVSELRILHLLENSRYKESCKLIEKSYSSKNVSYIFHKDICNKIGKLSRQRDDIKILECFLDCSGGLFNVYLRNQLEAFNLLKTEEYCSKIFPVIEIIASEIANDDDSITKAYQQAWKVYQDTNDISTVKNLTSALMIHSTSEQVLENIGKLEEVNFNLLPNLYSVCLKRINNLDQFDFLLKVIKNHPLLSAQSHAYLCSVLLEKYDYMIKTAPLDRQMNVFSEIENNFSRLESYFYLPGVLERFVDSRHKTYFGNNLKMQESENVTVALETNENNLLKSLLQ